jgi:serine/threonine protein kinase
MFTDRQPDYSDGQDNILISADGVAHVADFDMIVLADSSLGRQATDSGNRGTAAFKAPERFMGLKRPNEAGDVYAFACLCVVVSTKCDVERADLRAVSKVSTGGKALFDNDEPGAIANYVGHEDKRPQRPSAAHCRGPPITDDFWHLIETCWRTKPQERLTMREVLAYFHRNVLYESPVRVVDTRHVWR